MENKSDTKREHCSLIAQGGSVPSVLDFWQLMMVERAKGSLGLVQLEKLSVEMEGVPSLSRVVTKAIKQELPKVQDV